MPKPIEQQIPEIFGDVLSEGRNTKNLSRSDLAGVLCLAAKHIEQLEEGGNSAFFSKAHKVQVAKKVADHLGIPHEKILSSLPVQSPQESSDQKIQTATFQDSVPESIKELPAYADQTDTSLTKGLDKKKLWIGIFLLGLAGLIVYLNFIPSPSQIYEASSVQEVKKDPLANIPKLKEEPKIEVENPAGKQEIIAEKNIEDPCNIPVQAVSQFTAPKVSFPGNFVYLVSRADQKICVIDGKGVKQTVTLALGEKKNVPGIAPFTILAKDFSNVNVYFQGWRAIPSTSTTNTIKVHEVPLTVKPVEEVLESTPTK